MGAYSNIPLRERNIVLIGFMGVEDNDRSACSEKVVS